MAKYDWVMMEIADHEVKAGLPIVRSALKDHTRVGAAFVWYGTPQGHDFWAGYQAGRNQAEGKRFLQDMLNQLSA